MRTPIEVRLNRLEATVVSLDEAIKNAFSLMNDVGLTEEKDFKRLTARINAQQIKYRRLKSEVAKLRSDKK